MKRKYFIIPLMLSALALASCGKSELKGFDRFIDSIEKSEQEMNRYNETAEIKDNDMYIYSKVTEYNIKRGEQLRTDVVVTELNLSDDGSGLIPSTSSYWTVGDKKYERINNEVFETPFTIPSYFLTFVPQESFFSDGYTFTQDKGNMTLSGSIKESEISAFFANKSVNGIKNVNVDIKLENDKLVSFDASYTTKNNKDASIHTTYQYPAVEPGKVDHVNAVFHLEGGECKGVTDKVTYKYDLYGGYETLIVDPNVLVPDSIKRANYHIVGWFRTKEVVDGEAIYKDQWNFSTDKMGRDGVELYAKWEKDTHHTFEVIYKNEATGEETVLQTYNAVKGSRFEDFLDSSTHEALKGRTLIGFKDETGQPWNSNYTHPGGEVDTAVKVYADTIEGEYQVIKDASDFEKIDPKKNVYLANDIDLKRKQVSFKEFSGIFLGNGHKITNGRIKYDSSRNGLSEDRIGTEEGKTVLYISLFNDLKDNSVIKDVKFENFTLEIKTATSQTKKIVVAPIAVTAGKATIENVSFTGEFKISRVPKTTAVDVCVDNLVHTTKDTVIKEAVVNVKLIDNRNK